MDDIVWGPPAGRWPKRSLQPSRPICVSGATCASKRGCGLCGVPRACVFAAFGCARVLCCPARARWHGSGLHVGALRPPGAPAWWAKRTAGGPGMGRSPRLSVARAGVSMARAGGWQMYTAGAIPVAMKESPARRSRRVVDQRPEQAACCLPRPQAPGQAQRQPGLSFSPSSMARPAWMGGWAADQIGCPAGGLGFVGEPQGARGVGRVEPDGHPKAPRAAALAC